MITIASIMVQFFVLVFFTAIVCVASVPTDYKCGYLPRELTLKRGERQKLIFWNDRYGSTGCGVFKGEGGYKIRKIFA